MARWFFVFCLIICLGVPVAASSAPTPLAKVVEAQLDLLDIGEMERLIANLDGEVQAQLPSLDIGQLILGNQGIDWGNLLGALTRYLFREVVANSRLLARLVVARHS